MKIREYFYRLKGKDDFVTKEHSHEEIEFINVVEGSGTVIKNNRSYPLKKGWLYLIDARNPHIVFPENCEEYVRNKIVVDAEWFFQLCFKVGFTQKEVENLLESPPACVKDVIKTDGIFKKVSELCKKDDVFSKAEACAELIKLLCITFSSSLDDKSNDENLDYIQKILDCIKDADGIISLEEICSVLHFNRYYLCHLFKEKTGITIGDYIMEKRLSKSKALLKSDLSISEIAHVCGFDFLSSFTRFFKQKTGLSPLDYRKKQKADKIKDLS